VVPAVDGDELAAPVVVAGVHEQVFVLPVGLDDLLELESMKESRQL
jgi:hypothetical protein